MGEKLSPSGEDFSRLPVWEIAGERILIHHNTFLNPKVRPIAIRGKPSDKAKIYNNWFAQEKPGAEVLRPWPASPESNVFLYNNAFGRTKPVIFE